LQESFEIQGRFISNASHELSTPLTAIGNQIDVVLQKQRSNEEYLEVLRSVQSDVQQMNALTQQLLNSARTVRGGILPTEPVRIDEIIMELPSQLKKTNAGYIVRTFFDEFPDDENLFTVNGNYELLLSAFKNIAENACKYSPDNTVSISMSLIANKIVILFNNVCESFDVTDTAAIFQPFQRGANAMNTEGHGLGLSLARRIIQLHKGEIKAELMHHNKIVVSTILPSIA
jgi:signal transduction histidine kinase